MPGQHRQTIRIIIIIHIQSDPMKPQPLSSAIYFHPLYTDSSAYKIISIKASTPSSMCRYIIKCALAKAKGMG
jgi:hypothetical protein